jgi:Zinc carboxypeptidase/Bacterial TSP3 repeat
LNQDTDGDGIPDEREYALGSDPYDPDTDHDGFPDDFEDTYRPFGFDIVVWTVDSDADGLSDTLESSIGTQPDRLDSDGDGYGDFDEFLNSYVGFDPTTYTLDADRDGLGDGLELSVGTSALLADTDGDGANDFEEYRSGFDPTHFDLPTLFTEQIGTTASAAMLAALPLEIFPSVLAPELPYPEVTAQPAALGLIQPTSALMQSSVHNPLVLAAAKQPAKPLYASFDTIVGQLGAVARNFPAIVDLYQWSQLTDGKRRLYALRISDNAQTNECEPEVQFLSMHHARELITTPIVSTLIDDLTSKYANNAGIKALVDGNEIWVIPVVNPDGYERALGEWDDMQKKKGAGVNWRKNTRQVAPAQKKLIGVDLNRNYGFEHISTLNAAARAALSKDAKLSNGLDEGGNFNLDNETYGGTAAFTEVETQAVRGLAKNRFRNGSQVDGLKCSLSWHSWVGEVAHPYGHDMQPDLTAAERQAFKKVSDAFAQPTGYKNIYDTWKTKHYPTYGDSDDWLFKDANGVLALTVEAFSLAEHGPGDPGFFPATAARRDAVSQNNVKGALAFIGACH